MDVISSATSTIEFKDEILRFELSPFEWSQNLVCIGFTNKIAVVRLKFQEDDEDIEDGLEHTILKEFHHDVKVHALAWSPETCLDVMPKCVSFASADADYKVRLFTSDLSTNHDIEVLTGHTDYVNCITFDVEGKLLFSGSDDNSMKIWGIKEDCKCIGSLNFNSPVMSISSHRDHPDRVLVGVMRGVVHLVSLQVRRSLKSFPTDSSPLQMADWAPCNSKSVAALSNGELIHWDIAKTSWPSDIRLAYTICGQYLRFCPSSDLYVAIFGQPDHTLKVFNTNSSKPLLTASLESSSWISWHFRLPYISAASDRKLCFWKVSTK